MSFNLNPRDSSGGVHYQGLLQNINLIFIEDGGQVPVKLVDICYDCHNKSVDVYIERDDK